jgi:hypothetical protein
MSDALCVQSVEETPDLVGAPDEGDPSQVVSDPERRYDISVAFSKPQATVEGTAVELHKAGKDPVGRVKDLHLPAARTEHTLRRQAWVPER